MEKVHQLTDGLTNIKKQTYVRSHTGIVILRSLLFLRLHGCPCAPGSAQLGALGCFFGAVGRGDWLVLLARLEGFQVFLSELLDKSLVVASGSGLYFFVEIVHWERLDNE